ncbi:unnamed protein product, partial [Coregonus sp. 'balchen']
MSSVFQTCPACFRAVQRVSELSSVFQTCPACFRPVQRVSDLSSVFQSCPACFRPVQRVSDLSSLFQTCPACFRPVQRVSDLSELTGKCDLLSLNGKTLSVTSGSSPSDSCPSSESLVSSYVNLQLANCQPADVGTLLLVNPVGHDCLTHNALLSETAKVFGLRSRRLKLYLDDALTQGKTDTTSPILDGLEGYRPGSAVLREWAAKRSLDFAGAGSWKLSLNSTSVLLQLYSFLLLLLYTFPHQSYCV